MRDSGPGISPENIGRLFEPFFTTKPKNFCTGLGLAVAHRIITRPNGTIALDSLIGEGAEFKRSAPAGGTG